jgi:flagellar FliL protein
MPPFSVPTIREAGVVGQISLIVTIEVVGTSDKNKLIEKRHHLQSGFLRDLYGIASINNGSGQALQLDTVKKRLKMVADRVLGPGIVKNVLVENAHTRPID